jgi:flotillin
MPDFSDPQVLGLAIGIGVLVILGLIIFFKANIVLCQPNQLLILAGRQHKGPDGSRLGYRVIRGGRGFKWPFVETVARLELTTLPLELRGEKAMCEGMIPVTVVGKANVKLAGRPEQGMDDAIERFLGKGPDAVVKTAKQALEGALRGVLATVEPAQANADRLSLAKGVTADARANLRQLGIVLDFFQIQDLNDERGYLEAIGRQRNAEVQRDAKVAEARADAEARQVAAEMKQTARSAEIAAELKIIADENALAVKQSELDAEANQARERAGVAGRIARTEEEIQLQAKRVELSEKTQEAETVIPARAQRDADRLKAEGRSARTLEEGRATAKAVELMRAQWEDETTRDLFMIQLLPNLTDKVTRVVSDNLRVDKLTILDGGDGEGLPNYVKNLTNSGLVMLEQVKNATGVDLAKLAERQGGGTATIPKELG